MVDIVGLPELLVGNVSNNDLLIVRDTGAPSSPDRKVTRGNFLNDVPRTGGDPTFNAGTFNSITSPVASIDEVTVASQIVMGGKLQKILIGTGTLPASLATNTGNTQTITVTGAVVGDVVLLQTSATAQALILRGYVSATNTVTVLSYNPTAGTMTLGNTFQASVLRLVA